MSHTEEDSGVDTHDTPFNTVSDIELSTADRYKRVFDEWVIASLREIFTDARARLGFILVTLFVLMGTVGVMIVQVPKPNQGPRSLQPFQDMAFPLGTDQLGRGILAQIVHATPAMLIMILAGGVFAIAMATVFGAISGYKGGAVDDVLMTLADIMMAIPGLPLVIVISAIIEPKRPSVVGIILAINVWAGLARTIRSQVLTLRDQDYIESSRLMGISTRRIVLKDILPNLMPYILVKFVNAARYIIFASVGLYFLGFLPFTNANWGVMINQAYKTSNLYVGQGLHWMTPPMIAIILFSLGLIMLAQGFDRIFNPAIRAKHANKESTEASPEDHEESTTSVTEF